MNESVFDLRLHQLHRDPFSDVRGRRIRPGLSLPAAGAGCAPRSPSGRASNHALEPLPDPRFQRQRGGRLLRLPLDVARVVLLLGTVARQLLEIAAAVRRGPTGERSLEQAAASRDPQDPGSGRWSGCSRGPRAQVSGEVPPGTSTSYSPRPMSLTTARERSGNASGRTRGASTGTLRGRGRLAPRGGSRSEPLRAGRSSSIAPVPGASGAATAGLAHPGISP